MVLQPMALATPVANSLPEWQVDARSLGMEPRTSVDMILYQWAVL